MGRIAQRMRSSTRTLLLGIVLLLLVTLALGRNPGHKKKRNRSHNRSEKDYRNSFTKCEKSDRCTAARPPAQPKCSLKCLSEKCYDQIYGSDELEEGELDHVRRKQYKDCVRSLPTAAADQIDTLKQAEKDSAR